MPHQSVSIYLCGGSSTIYYHYELDKENYYHDNMTKEAEKDSRTESFKTRRYSVTPYD